MKGKRRKREIEVKKNEKAFLYSSSSSSIYPYCVACKENFVEKRNLKKKRLLKVCVKIIIETLRKKANFNIIIFFRFKEKMLIVYIFLVNI